MNFPYNHFPVVNTSVYWVCLIYYYIAINTYTFMRVSACQAAKVTENISAGRWPPSPGSAGYRLL